MPLHKIPSEFGIYLMRNQSRVLIAKACANSKFLCLSSTKVQNMNMEYKENKKGYGDKESRT